jgi:protoporphyrinogen oxidase
MSNSAAPTTHATSSSPTAGQAAPDAEKVLVAGAGPAGLTAAYDLMLRGHAPIVFEKDIIVGGHARTSEFKGYRFDMGGHRFFTKIRRVEKIWHDLMGEDMLQVPRLSRIFYNKAFFQYPLKIGNVLKGLGLWNSGMIGLSYLYALAFPYREVNTFEEWVVNRFGRRLYETFFKSYTEKVWGIPCSEIGADWAAQRIQGLSVRAALLHAVVGDRSGKAKTLIDQFQYPKLGPGQLWERMADAIDAGGGAVQRQRPVRKILRDGNVITGFLVGNDDDSEVITGTHYIGSMPISIAIRMMDPPPPPEVIEAAAALKHRDFMTICVIVDHPDLFPDNWIYIHEPEVHMGRLQNFKNWSPYMVPDPKMSSLGGEYFVTVGDELWSMADEDLVEMTRREVDQLGIVSADKVLDGVVYRRPNAYPVYEGDYKRHLLTIEEFFKSFTNLQMVGRSGLHKYNNQDHSMLTALLAVENLYGSDHDIWAVNSDDEYHEEVTGREEIPGQGDESTPASD